MIQLCLANKIHRARFGTCNCDIHCSWDLCRVLNPPSDCLLGTHSTWKLDNAKNAWVAQLLGGNGTCLSYNIFEQHLTQYRLRKSFSIFMNVFIEKENLKWKSCASDAYGSYSSLDQARAACISDINCKGVHDSACDGLGTLRLCPLAAALKESTTSCLYSQGIN